MQVGGFAAAGLLALWARFSSLFILYVTWAGLGCCMAAILYEPAFAIIGRTIENAEARLRALATLTVLGGLASTVFMPSTAILIRALGWRGAVGVLAFALVLSTCMVSHVAFRRSAGSNSLTVPCRAPARPATAVTSRDRRLRSILFVFSCASFASAAFTTNLVPALVERHLSPTSAAALGGLLGVMQLPGRAVLMNGRLSASPSRLLVVSLVLQAAGLAILVIARSSLAIGGAVSVFASGAGLTTIVRPYLLQTIFRIDRAGYLNGVVARVQQLARAGGPVLSATLATVLGYRFVFALMACALAVLALTSRTFRNVWSEVR